MGKFDWMSNPQYLAQVGHFLGGALLVFVAGVFGGHSVMFWVFGLGIVLAGLKEFVFDVASWGEGDSWGDSAMDFTFYALGGLVGLGLFFIGVVGHASCLCGPFGGFEMW